MSATDRQEDDVQIGHAERDDHASQHRQGDGPQQHAHADQDQRPDQADEYQAAKQFQRIFDGRLVARSRPDHAGHDGHGHEAQAETSSEAGQ